jgi:quercetin dioxygenase-like cupin family protein
MKTIRTQIAVISMLALLTTACTEDSEYDPAAHDGYEIVSAGTRQFEWDTETEPAWIKVLIEESNLGSKGVEIAEVYFPPEYHGDLHPHELEIIYVLEGELDHIVNGESHILTPGMVGVVRAPDLVVHKSISEGGVRTLIVWPLGKEVAGFEDAGMRETSLAQ